MHDVAGDIRHGEALSGLIIARRCARHGGRHEARSRAPVDSRNSEGVQPNVLPNTAVK